MIALGGPLGPPEEGPEDRPGVTDAPRGVAPIAREPVDQVRLDLRSHRATRRRGSTRSIASATV